MKKILKNLSLFFCINLTPNFNNLFSMAKSPTPPHRREIWHFTEPLALKMGGKTGSCISTTKKEISKTYDKLRKLSESENAKLFIALLNHITCDIKLEPHEIGKLRSLGFLDSEGKKIPLVSMVLSLMIKLENGHAQFRSLDEINKFLKQIL